ncbi:hypothetical protein KIW84_035491 [Lathyrus oleraceus]|uniref:Uncharacterized protein n=1 Tax=Pisum sativum TaxID=3888 RepID=A0A9D4Y3S5_PEA|nr:hypothetical protein KIW84_035491 [Pisum sativum]
MGKKIKPTDLSMTLGISPEDLLSHYKKDRDAQGHKARRMAGAERKVTRAWEKVHVKDSKPKRKDTLSEESYTPWIRERVCLVKLPFIIDPAYIPDIPNPITVTTEEVDRLKATISRMEQDKEILEHSLYDATYEKNQISYNLEQKDRQLLENMEELWVERSKRQKTLGGLFSAKVNFENLNGKLKEAQAEGQRWKMAYELAVWEQ